MLHKALEQIDRAAKARRQEAEARRKYEAVLVFLKATFATLVLPIVYAATLPTDADADPDANPPYFHAPQRQDLHEPQH